MQKDVVGQRLGAATAGMDAIDGNTFELKLKQPVTYTLSALAELSQLDHGFRNFVPAGFR
jgi:hypothetical protein